MGRQIQIGSLWLEELAYNLKCKLRDAANEKRVAKGLNPLPPIAEELLEKQRPKAPAAKVARIIGERVVEDKVLHPFPADLRGGIGSLDPIRMVGSKRKLIPGPVGKLGRVVSKGMTPPPGPWDPADEPRTRHMDEKAGKLLTW
jgi:hypothetical protein